MLHTHIQPHTHKKNTPFGLYLYFSHVLFWHLMQGIWNATPVWLHEIQTAFCINTHAKLVKLHHSVWWNCPRESKRKLSTTEHIPVPKDHSWPQNLRPPTRNSSSCWSNTKPRGMATPTPKITTTSPNLCVRRTCHTHCLKLCQKQEYCIRLTQQ